MPSPTVIRQYIENGYYHIYNRGVEKRLIFLDNQDYRMFLYYLFIYLAPPIAIGHRYPKLKWNLKQNNLSGVITLLAYCLMPNHFHFLVKQGDKEAITKFLRRLTNAYTRYFNNKYDRVGSLMQGKFKSKLVEDDNYLLYLTAYIHRNAANILQERTLEEYPWSSYSTYRGKRPSLYIDSNTVLGFFSKMNLLLSYESFVASDASTSVLPADYYLDGEDDTHIQGRTLSIEGKWC